MNKYQLALGVISSIITLAALVALSFVLQASAGALHPSSFALIGWVSGMVGLFVAGSE